jgi:epoxyqueuosine reductase
VIACRIPAGAFRSKTNVVVQYLDMLVMRRMDKIAYRLAEYVERAGHPTFVTAAQETDWKYKKASYGRLSTRHLGVEAGLGTLGLEVNILSPKFGPRIYLTGILTELALEPDHPMTEQVCIGESCSRCLHSCPSDAVGHFDIDKRLCSLAAQEFGFSTILKFFDRLVESDLDRQISLITSVTFLGIWQGMLRVVGSFGDCPRCLAVCPVGNDYYAHLVEIQRQIPEKTPEKVAKAKAFKETRASRGEIPGLNEWNIRWVGPDGYQGLVGRQQQQFRKEQAARHDGTTAVATEKNPMSAIVKRALTSSDIKVKAKELGADLVGIADGKLLELFPPPDKKRARRPSDITDLDSARVIVLAKHYSLGSTRILPWNDRHKYYNDELTLTLLEETSLHLVLWLEDNGYPAVIVPPVHVNPWEYDGNPGQYIPNLLSLPHAAVEAGLGTLGLGLQLITPEYGPRVLLTAVLCSVDVEADMRRQEALCLGPECGRCVLADPSGSVGHWNRDWSSALRYRSPHGFHDITEHVVSIMEEPDVTKKKQMIRSETSFNIWQSMLRGAGVITGDRRCQDVCPVGADYESMLKDALEEIPERTPEKDHALAAMRDAESKGEFPASYEAQRRWIGELNYFKS